MNQTPGLLTTLLNKCTIKSGRDHTQQIEDVSMVVASSTLVTYEGDRKRLVEEICKRIDSELQKNLGSEYHRISIIDLLPSQNAATLAREYDWLFKRIVDTYTAIGKWRIVSVGKPHYVFKPGEFEIVVYLSNHPHFTLPDSSKFRVFTYGEYNRPVKKSILLAFAAAAGLSLLIAIAIFGAKAVFINMGIMLAIGIFLFILVFVN